MKQANRSWGWALGMSAGLGFLLSGCNSTSSNIAPVASAQVKANTVRDPSQWGLQVASVNNVPDTASIAFQETFKLVNFGTAARDASEVFAVVYFDVPQGDPNQVVFVNSTFASVFNPNGTPTGVNSSVQLTTAGLFGPCINQGTHQVITSNFGFTFQTGTIVPPNGGFVTWTPELWRGGHFPFNDNNDWTAQSGVVVVRLRRRKK